jgi:hypothetical protein
VIDAGASGDAGTPPDAVVRPEAGPLPDAARPSSDLDGNTTWSEGPWLMPGDPPLRGEIASEGDLDYVRIAAEQGQYLAVRARREPSPEFGLGPTVVVVGPEMRALAVVSAQEGCAGDPDALEAVFRVPETGTYYLEIFAAGPGGTRGAVPWNVDVVDLATAPTTLLVDEGREATLSDAHRCVLGAFDGADDVDDVGVAVAPYRWLVAADPARHASTGGPSSLVLQVGDSVRARSEPGALGVVHDGTPGAVLRVTGPARAGGNDHYLLHVWPVGYRGPGVTGVEAGEPANDAFATAEPISIGLPDELGYAPWFALTLPAGDVDHFVLELADALRAGRTTADLVCTARELGSAVRDLELTSLAPDGTPLASSVERDAREINRARITLDARVSTRYVVRLRAGSYAPGIDGTLAACSVRTR